MDDLKKIFDQYMKDYIDGKITDFELNQKREKLELIAGEPINNFYYLIDNGRVVKKYFKKENKDISDNGVIGKEKESKVKNNEDVNYDSIKVVMIKRFFPKCSAVLNKKYNIEWLENYMSSLMDSKHKDAIAAEWTIDRKRKKVYCAILGALKDKGVYESTYAAIARMIYEGDSDESEKDKKRKERTLAEYIGKNKNHIIGKWTTTYEK